MSNADDFIKKYSGINLIKSLISPDEPTRAAAATRIKKPVAPTPDDPTAKRRKQREVSRKYGETGRAGTMLTDDTKLG